MNTEHHHRDIDTSSIPLTRKFESKNNDAYIDYNLQKSGQQERNGGEQHSATHALKRSETKPVILQLLTTSVN